MHSFIGDLLYISSRNTKFETVHNIDIYKELGNTSYCNYA